MRNKLPHAFYCFSEVWIAGREFNAVRCRDNVELVSFLHMKSLVMLFGRTAPSELPTRRILSVPVITAKYIIRRSR